MTEWTGATMADFLGLMKQAAELKSKMEALQAELDQIEVEGTSGGGLVTVKLTPKGELRAVKIDPSLIKPEEKEILEDLLVAAHTDGRRKAEALLQEKMRSLTGGLPLPPGMKLF
jgi:DNA-binding YbaB/EbfC family protein